MQAMLFQPRPTRSPAVELLRHGATVLGVCLFITLLLTKMEQGSWDVNLVYSLAIGLPVWLTIETGRRLFSGNAHVPWPAGWRGVALVIVAVLLGFSLGSTVGHAYQAWMSPTLEPAKAPALLYPMLITVVTSALMSAMFYLVGKARYLQMQAEQSQRQAAEAHLKLLQAQLEPHMLFNTLANLRVLISLDAARAEQMLDHLIDYLRATLSGSRSGTHSLAAEFALLADYLALMKIRMGERLNYQLDLPSELADIPVPPLLLQPLVENSIRHGLEPQLAGGQITVRADKTEQGQLVLTVTDNGRGLQQAPEQSSGTRFGVQQVRERLSNRYGEAATFDLIAEPEGGTRACITFTSLLP